MNEPRLPARFVHRFDAALALAQAEDADAVLVFLETEEPVDPVRIARRAEEQSLILVAPNEQTFQKAQRAGLQVVRLDHEVDGVYERVSRALLEAVAGGYLRAGAKVVALYSGFEMGLVDTISVVLMREHLARFTVRELRKLETSVPLDTLQAVVSLAVEIAREGREGHPVGTIFVVGDHRKVLQYTSPAGFDPVRGYNKKERNLKLNKVREAIKEIAMLDGAFIVAADGTVVASCRLIVAPTADLTLSKGLGARHWAAAAITRVTKAIAVAVSESGGTVRIFQNGEVVLRIEPYKRPVVWRQFEYEAPDADKG